MWYGEALFCSCLFEILNVPYTGCPFLSLDLVNFLL
jgi:hypothetical protein